MTTYEFKGAALVHLIENVQSRDVRSGEIKGEYNVPLSPPSEVSSSNSRMSPSVLGVPPNLQSTGICGRVDVVRMDGGYDNLPWGYLFRRPFRGRLRWGSPRLPRWGLFEVVLVFWMPRESLRSSELPEIEAEGSAEVSKVTGVVLVAVVLEEVSVEVLAATRRDSVAF